MITRIENGRIIADGKIRDAFVYMENGTILAVTEENLPFDRALDAKGMYVSPGFVDIRNSTLSKP